MIRLVKMSITGFRGDEFFSYLRDEVLMLEGVMKVYALSDEAIVEVQYDNSLVNFNFIKDAIERVGCQVV